MLHRTLKRFTITLSLFALGIHTFSVSAQESTALAFDDITSINFSFESAKQPNLDYENAIPRTLPLIRTPPMISQSTNSKTKASAAASSGGLGKGVPQVILAHPPTVTKSPIDLSADSYTPNEFGTSEHPFTTSRVDTDPVTFRTSRTYPYRPTGKLYFKIGGSTYVCSASLVKPGVLVTAAHCVSDFGEETFFSNFEFHPAKYNASILTGKWYASSVAVKTSYFNGSESCAVSGIVCPNDVATIKLRGKQAGTYYPGHTLGWYGYGWNGYGFSESFLDQTVEVAQISQLGYPVSHDSGLRMQRNDSTGFSDSSLSNNSVIGSRMTGGSSGGPWLVNLGKKASGASIGSEGLSNVVVGVTSWGYISSGPKQQGASPFTVNNIKSLVELYCPIGSTNKRCVQ